MVLMNNIQLKILQSQGPSLVVLDSTHGTNSYGFQLTTLLVSDKDHSGFPVAFLISARVNRANVTTFLNAIKGKAGPISTNALMSDDDPVFNCAWSAVMGSPEHKLLCSWHVTRAWQKHMDKIKDQHEVNKLKSLLQALHHELDVECFESKLKNFTIEFHTSTFGRYFLNNYLHRKKEWAYCYRKNIQVNTRMHLERFHRTFKS